MDNPRAKVTEVNLIAMLLLHRVGSFYTVCTIWGSSIDLLEFGDGKRIKKMQVGKWDIGKSSIDYHSLIPKM